MTAFFLLVAPLLTPGEIALSPSSFVKNDQEVGLCMWCSLEMLGRHYGIEPLYGLKNDRKNDSGEYVRDRFGRQVFRKANDGHQDSVRKKLDQLGVRYELTPPGPKDAKRLAESLKQGRACVVVVMLPDNVRHAVVLTHLDDEWCYYVDPNLSAATVIQSRGWFDRAWDGYSVFLPP